VTNAREYATFRYWYGCQAALAGQSNGLKLLQVIVTTTCEDTRLLREASSKMLTIIANRKGTEQNV